MTFLIQITKSDGTTGTIECPDFSYVDPINTMREGYLKFKILNKTDLTLLSEGSSIKIYRNSILEFFGEITDIEKFSGGGVKVNFGGAEISLGRENGDYSNSPWVATASASIFADIIGESSNWTAGTINTGVDTDFRARKTNSLLNSLGSLKEATGQDIEFNDADPTDLKVNILDHRGSSTSIMVLNEGISISNTSYKTGYPIGNDVRVYGKGDGENQIISDYSTYGQDATSKSTYGTIRKIVYDTTIMTVDQANQLADILVAKYKLPRKVYSFSVLDPNLEITTGDVITINSPQLNLTEELRVTAVERGYSQNSEFLKIEVTNKEYSETDIATNKKLLELEKNNRQNQTYMQGSANTLTFAGMINANNSAPLRIDASLPANFIEDEAGAIRVNSFTLDYDIDPYRSGVGDATVSGTTGDEHPATNGSSGTFEEFLFVDSDTFSSISCSDSSWTTLSNFGVGSSDRNSDLLILIYVNYSSGGPEDILLRLGIDGNTADIKRENAFDTGDTVKYSVYVPAGVSTTSSYAVHLECYPQTGAITLSGYMEAYKIGHNHDEGSYKADDHGHDGSSLSVSIGDGISDSGSLNASQVSIYLDYWNGSSWVNKHSILNTGKTIDTDVDISNGGTYPDAVGYWRTRIFTDSATPDLVQAIIKLKHNIEP